MTSEKMLNGVNVSAVKNLINDVKENPELAKSKFRASNEWMDGGHNRTTVTSFYSAGQEISHTKRFILEADEPPILAGQDQAANPVEHLLNALATWMTTTMVYHAAVRGIKLDQVESRLEGDLDLSGFFGINDDVRPGYEEIRVNFKVKTDLENLETLKELIKLSPVYDVISNGTKVDVQIEIK
jgi:uncharacterized OsmC-like protein